MSHRKHENTLRILALLVGLFAFINTGFAQATAETGNASIRNFKPAEYDAHGQNFDAIQDDRGFLYVANASGILEYDGTSWRLIPTANGSMIRSLAKDENGRIYVGARTEFGYLNVNAKSGEMEFVSLSANLEEAAKIGDVWGTHVASDGVYFVTGKYVFKHTESGIEAIELPAKVFDSYLVRGNVWLQLDEMGLGRLANHKFEMVFPKIEDEEGVPLLIKNILPVFDDYFFVVSKRNGVYSGKKGSGVLEPMDWEINALLKKGLVNTAAVMPDGGLAFATEYFGIITCAISGEIQFLANKRTGLQDQFIHNLYVDSQSGVWAMLNNGISRIEIVTPITQFNEMHNLEGTVNDVKRYKDRLLVATSQGLYQLHENDVLTGLETTSKPLLRSFDPSKYTNLACYHVEIYNDQFYVASAGGIYEWDGTSLNHINNEYTFSLAMQGNTLYAGELDEVQIFSRESGSWKQVGTVETGSEVMNMLVTPSGKVLAETSAQGIWLIENGEGKRLDVNGSLLNNQLFEFDGKVYALNQDGTFLFNSASNTFENVSDFIIAEGQDWLGMVTSDGQGGYFTVGGRGTEIAHVSTVDTLPKPYVVPFSGWKDFAVNCIWVAPNGVVWIGGPEGLLRYDSRDFKIYPKDFQCHIRNVTIQGDSIHFAGNYADSNGLQLMASVNTNKPKFKPSQNSIEFAFSAMEFDASDVMEYQFFLEGFDNDWSEWTEETVKEYTNLDDQSYTFHVRARNGYGFVSSDASFSFSILTPWYAQWWAFILYALAFGGITMLVVRVRSNQLEKEKRELEKMVDERTSEIMEQKEEIESQSESLYLKNQELEKINQMVGSINTGISFSAVMSGIVDEIRFIRDAERSIALVLDLKANHFVANSYYSWDDETASSIHLTEEEAEALLLQRSSKVGEDLYYVAEGYPTELTEKYKEFAPAKTSLILIIRVEEQTRGYIVLECLSSPNAFSPADFDLMSSFKEHVVSAFIKSKIMNELQETFDNLQQTQAKLVSQEKMAGLGQLTAGIAHEINNPINFVSGNIKPLRRDMDDIKEVLDKYAELKEDSDIKELLEDIEELKEDIDFDFVLDEVDGLIDDIENGANRTAEIVKDLRNFSRLDEASLKKASVEDGLDSTLSILKNKYKDRVEVVKEYANLEPIDCYAGKLNQVFMNIINNGVQAIEGRGTLTLKTEDKGENVVVTIRDSGSGMTEETKQKLFDPFYTTKDVGEGTGLGMSISFGIIKDHNGTIEFDSELGKGTEFVITLPKKQAANKEEL